MFFEEEKVKCTECGKCKGKCGLGIDVPKMILLYNDFLDGKQAKVKAEIEKIPEDQRPNNCFGCGKCQFFCPEQIEIWKVLGRFANLLK